MTKYFKDDLHRKTCSISPPPIIKLFNSPLLEYMWELIKSVAILAKRYHYKWCVYSHKMKMKQTNGHFHSLFNHVFTKFMDQEWKQSEIHTPQDWLIQFYSQGCRSMVRALHQVSFLLIPKMPSHFYNNS